MTFSTPFLNRNFVKSVRLAPVPSSWLVVSISKTLLGPTGPWICKKNHDFSDESGKAHARRTDCVYTIIVCVFKVLIVILSIQSVNFRSLTWRGRSRWWSKISNRWRWSKTSFGGPFEVPFTVVTSVSSAGGEELILSHPNSGKSLRIVFSRTWNSRNLVFFNGKIFIYNLVISATPWVIS